MDCYKGSVNQRAEFVKFAMDNERFCNVVLRSQGMNCSMNHNRYRPLRAVASLATTS